MEQSGRGIVALSLSKRSSCTPGSRPFFRTPPFRKSTWWDCWTGGEERRVGRKGNGFVTLFEGADILA